MPARGIRYIGQSSFKHCGENHAPAQDCDPRKIPLGNVPVAKEKRVLEFPAAPVPAVIVANTSPCDGKHRRCFLKLFAPLLSAEVAMFYFLSLAMVLRAWRSSCVISGAFLPPSLAGATFQDQTRRCQSWKCCRRELLWLEGWLHFLGPPSPPPWAVLGLYPPPSPGLCTLQLWVPGGWEPLGSNPVGSRWAQILLGAVGLKSWFWAAEPPVLAPMDAPTPTQAPSRPSLLQLLRNLFELPGRMWGTQEAGAEVQELGAVGDSSSPGELAGQCGERWEGAGGCSTEPLLETLAELNLSGSLGSSTSRSCPSLSTSDTELATAGDMGDALASNPAWQSAGSEEGTAMTETFGDKVLERDGLLQALGADGEDVTGSGSPELMFSVDLDSELEAEQLLTADEGAGSPKTELSQWNRLFSMNRPRWTSLKSHALGSSMALESEEEPLLNTTANKRAASVPPLLPLNPPQLSRGFLKREQEKLSAALGEAGYSTDQMEQEPLEKAEIQLLGEAGSNP